VFDLYRGDRVACAPESSLQDLDDALSAAVAAKRHGAQYEPTVLVDVEPSMRVVCEEVFGPVVTVQRYRDLPPLFEQISAALRHSRHDRGAAGPVQPVT
jgi:acyl-CoA reductase-like NAD-dependent aldehyde dehydrogenase